MPQKLAALFILSAMALTGLASHSSAAPAVVYKEFIDEPLSPNASGDVCEYAPDGSTTTKWFEDNTNFREILASASSVDKEALMAFTKGHFMYGQLYRGFATMSPLDKLYVRSCDGMLDKSVVSANVKLTRFSTPELLFG